MHLAFLTPEYPHSKVTASGGLGISIQNLATALVSKDVQVSLFIYGQKEDAVFTENDIKLHLIRKRKFKFLSWYLHRKSLQNYINKYVAIDRIDALEAPDWTGITAFMTLKCPLVIRFHGSDGYFCHLENRKQKAKNRFLEKTALKGADHLISVSQFTADETQKIFNLKTPIAVIPNSIDPEVFKPRDFAEDGLSILYFGTLIRKKGVLEIPKYLNELVTLVPDCQFILAGKDVVDKKTGQSTKQLMLHQMSEAVKLNCQFLGHLAYKDIKLEIDKASVIILPSFAEALPMTWIEAMAMEKALVSSNIGWAKEVMVDGKTGFMVNPKKHKQFANRILELLEDKDKRKHFGKNARQQVLEKFETKHVVKKNTDFYNSILGL